MSYLYIWYLGELSVKLQVDYGRRGRLTRRIEARGKRYNKLEQEMINIEENLFEFQELRSTPIREWWQLKYFHFLINKYEQSVTKTLFMLIHLLSISTIEINICPVNPVVFSDISLLLVLLRDLLRAI